MSILGQMLQAAPAMAGRVTIPPVVMATVKTLVRAAGDSHAALAFCPQPNNHQKHEHPTGWPDKATRCAVHHPSETHAADPGASAYMVCPDVTCCCELEHALRAVDLFTRALPGQ